MPPKKKKKPKGAGKGASVGDEATAKAMMMAQSRGYVPLELQKLAASLELNRTAAQAAEARETAKAGPPKLDPEAAARLAAHAASADPYGLGVSGTGTNVRLQCTCMPRALKGQMFIGNTCQMHAKQIKGYEGGGMKKVRSPRLSEATMVRRLDEFSEHRVTSSDATPKTVIRRKLVDEMLEKYTLFLQQSEPWSKDLAEVFSRRATLFALIRQYERSRRDALKCIQLDPEYVAGHYRLGLALYAQRQYEAAAEAFVRGLKLSPTSVDLKRGFDMAMDQARSRARRAMPGSDAGAAGIAAGAGMF